jgi:gamma-glutamylcyclotransferase (GGCT)/AIG2-like uncharacterized protein YtfP
MEQPDAGDRQGAFSLLSGDVSTIFYFAYGSNMSTPRIRRRIQSATVLSSAYLAGHCLRFRKKSVDGSAKCDIEYTRVGEDRVHGVVYEIPVDDKNVLDRYEGLGSGYEDRQVSIVLPGDDTIIASTYFATHIDASLKPFHWYKEHVLRGAYEHTLPGDYVEAIEAVHSIPDPDRNKHTAELSIYSDKPAFVQYPG